MLLLWAGWAPCSRAQSTVVVHLETNYPRAIVFADSVWLGSASQEVLVVPAQTRVLRLVPPSVDAWSIQPLTASLDAAAPGDTLSLRMLFPYHYRLESIPYGATVTLETPMGAFRLGKTPLTYKSEVPLEGTLRVDLPGYLREEQAPGADIWNRHVFALKPVAQPGAELAGSEVNWHPPRTRRTWIDYAAVGTALSAGVLAIHFKRKADRRFDRYQEDGDPALRSSIKRFDTYSGIALGVSQVSLGLFAFRLIFK